MADLRDPFTLDIEQTQSSRLIINGKDLDEWPDIVDAVVSGHNLSFTEAIGVLLYTAVLQAAQQDHIISQQAGENQMPILAWSSGLMGQFYNHLRSEFASGNLTTGGDLQPTDPRKRN